VAQRVDDSHRRVVPRWWSVPVASALGQLAPSGALPAEKAAMARPGELEQLRADWDANHSATYAANLIDAALTFNTPELAQDAAQWVLRNGGVSPVSLGLARAVLGSEPSSVDDPDNALRVPQDRWRLVGQHRRLLRLFPRNALPWVELARHYSVLGHVDAAAKALRIALSLAPNSRYVLRSASRFYLHARDPERAHRIVLAAPATTSDPWLLAAEIVAAEARGKTSRLVNVGSSTAYSRRFNALSVSELASALGTLEFKSGNRKKTRRHFARALENPTENSLAQAEWVCRHSVNFCPEGSNVDPPRAFEVHAWRELAAGNFLSAVTHSRGWLHDEPFASRPALLGSWIAAVALEDYDIALRLVESARIANPDDARLLVQEVYCLGSSGRVEEARALMPDLEQAAARGDATYTAAGWDALLHADRGLIAYRSGSLDEGRDAYMRALEIAAANRLQEAAASALINFAREEFRVSGTLPVPREQLTHAVDVFPATHRGAVSKFVERLAKPFTEGLSRSG